MTDKARSVVIGLGSPYGDDRLGWEVIRLLQKQSPPLPARLLSLDRPGTKLLSVLQDMQRAVIVDAVFSGRSPGSISDYYLAELPASVDRSRSSHGFDLLPTLRLGERLGLLPPHLYILGIEMQSHPATWQWNSPLSPTLLEGVQRATTRIREWLARGE